MAIEASETPRTTVLGWEHLSARTAFGFGCPRRPSSPSWVTPGRKWPSGRLLQHPCAARVETFITSTALLKSLAVKQFVSVTDLFTLAVVNAVVLQVQRNRIHRGSTRVRSPAGCSCSCRSEIKAPTPAVGTSGDTGSCSTRSMLCVRFVAFVLALFTILWKYWNWC